MTAPTIIGLDCGWMRTQARTLSSEGGTEEITIPVPAWLIRHPAGDALFDVGLHPDLATGTGTLGPLAKIFAIDLAERRWRCSDASGRPGPGSCRVTTPVSLRPCGRITSIRNDTVFLLDKINYVS